MWFMNETSVGIWLNDTFRLQPLIRKVLGWWEKALQYHNHLWWVGLFRWPERIMASLWTHWEQMKIGIWGSDQKGTLDYMQILIWHVLTINVARWEMIMDQNIPHCFLATSSLDGLCFSHPYYPMDILSLNALSVTIHSTRDKGP